MSDDEERTLPIEWPTAHRYANLVGGEGLGAWIRYKVWSADWYIDTLDRVGAQLGEDYDRYIGVEMALDGALAALCGAFDAAVGGIISEAEEFLNVSKATPVHRYSWDTCRPLLKKLPETCLPPPRALIETVDSALEGKSSPEPIGWLAVLQRLRNRAIHQNSLRRHIYGSTTGRGLGTKITVLDAATHPVSYLRDAADNMYALVNDMISVVQCIDGDIGFGQPVERSTWLAPCLPSGHQPPTRFGAQTPS
ncbi:hypothetical protein ACQPYH_39760 [Kribbella sp. CA-245084]|uniref:hypothetical protein n=1 Tax=Kribbella sp. CA-245084 TaxID=3239940 RepID=UPI003D8C40ED